MEANFKPALRFATRLSKYTHEYVFYDRFNSIFKGFYFVIGKSQAQQHFNSKTDPVFTKIPSTECFGSQDVTIIDKVDHSNLSVQDRHVLSYLNASVATKRYKTVSEKQPKF